MSNIVYRRSNGYGNIDIHSEPFQLGKKLFEAQGIYANLEWAKKNKIPMHLSVEEGMKVIEWFCELVHTVGDLRSDYDVLKRCVEGKAEFVADEPRKIDCEL